MCRVTTGPVGDMKQKRPNNQSIKILAGEEGTGEVPVRFFTEEAEAFLMRFVETCRDRGVAEGQTLSHIFSFIQEVVIKWYMED